MSDDGLRDLLLQLSPSARDHLRTVLIRDDRDEIAQLLLRYGDANGDGWADLIDTLTMYPDVCGGRWCGSWRSWTRQDASRALPAFPFGWSRA